MCVFSLNLLRWMEKHTTLLEAICRQKGKDRFLSRREIEKHRPDFHLELSGEMYITTVSLPGLSNRCLLQMQPSGVDDIKGKDLGKGLRIKATEGQSVHVDIEDSPRTSAGDHEEIDLAQSRTFSSLTEENWWQVVLDAQVIHEKPPQWNSE